MNVGQLREELGKFKDNDYCYAYEGEVSGVIINRNGEQGVIFCNESGESKETIVIKDKPSVILAIEGDVWSAMTSYIIEHIEDIEAGVNDYGELQPVLDYFNRNS